MAVRLRRHGGIPLHNLTVQKENVTVGLSRAGPGPGLGTAARDCGPGTVTVTEWLRQSRSGTMTGWQPGY